MASQVGFEIDCKAFRSQNLGRNPSHLIREAVQNAFDESPSKVTITLETQTRGLRLVVADDGPGFKDEKEIWTIFASGKRDDVTKRGRLGRGLKELIAVASEATVATVGKVVSFSWDKGKLSRSTRRTETTGTTITCNVPTWKRDQLDAITSYLRMFVPPTKTTMFVNGVENVRPMLEHTINACVKTIRYDEGGVPHETWSHTDLLLYRPGAAGRWIFEMGIPVEKISDEDGFEWCIDVQQRTPLRPERDMLPRDYVRSLYAAVANAMIDKLPMPAMTALWMEEAVGHYDFDKQTKGKVYVERRFGANAARAIVNDTHDRNQQAQQDGVTVIQTQHLGAGVRDLVKEFTPTTMDLYPMHCAESRYVPTDEWTPGERKFIAFGQWLAERMSLPKPMIHVIESPQASCLADSGESGTSIRINRSTLGAAYFDRPRLATWLSLLVHEISHRTGQGHDAVYWREFERLAGEAAEVVRDNVAELERFGVSGIVQVPAEYLPI